MTEAASHQAGGSRLGRIPAIDMARGMALIAMATYHFTWDLEFFGYVQRGLTAVGGWRLFARGIASSFLFLVGVSLYLAHRDGVVWPGFWRRWAMVVVAALAISIATYLAMPDTFIYFGILHEIAIASLLGLRFLRLPALLTIAVAIAIIALPVYFQSAFFDPRWLAWIGFAETTPRSNDFVPIFPWLGAVLLGIAAAKLAETWNSLSKLQNIGPVRGGLLAWLGRHSLAFYLIHQPVLLGLVWTASQFAPAKIEAPEVQFREECQLRCSQVQDAEFCARYCGCMLDGLQRNGGNVTTELRDYCTGSSDPDALGQEGQTE